MILLKDNRGGDFGALNSCPGERQARIHSARLKLAVFYYLHDVQRWCWDQECGQSGQKEIRHFVIPRHPRPSNGSLPTTDHWPTTGNKTSNCCVTIAGYIGSVNLTANYYLCENCNTHSNFPKSTSSNCFCPTNSLKLKDIYRYSI